MQKSIVKPLRHGVAAGCLAIMFGLVGSRVSAGHDIALVQQSAPATESVAGKWDFRMGRQTKLLSLALDGKKLTGNFSTPDGSPGDKIEGEYVDGRMTFTARVDAVKMDGNEAGPMTVKYEGRLTKDGSLAGTAVLEGYDERKPWTAVRAKLLLMHPLAAAR